jgi:hypothetical protein
MRDEGWVVGLVLGVLLPLCHIHGKSEESKVPEPEEDPPPPPPPPQEASRTTARNPSVEKRISRIPGHEGDRCLVTGWRAMLRPFWVSRMVAILG